MLRNYRMTLLTGLLLGFMMTHTPAFAEDRPSVESLKQAILAKAESFKGQGDPDRSKQEDLELLVNQLLQVAPQENIEKRIPLIAGAWKQVWGPYTYKNDARGIDPTLDPNHIYQVVFADGYYYNVSPDRDTAGRPKNRTILLRGEYKINPNKDAVINVHFTNLRGVQGTPPAGLSYIELPALSEAKRLKQFSILPSLFVRLFFGGGSLREVYTDQDLRITFGSGRKNLSQNYIYILQRVHP